MRKQKKYYRLLGATPVTKPQQTTAFNAINGGDSESLAAARFITAFRGEVGWGSRVMDNRKIDLILSCEHPWADEERLVVLAQVKSGTTFGEITTHGFEIKKPAIIACQRTSHSICLIWVDRDSDRVFWAYIHPQSKSDTQPYGRNHEVTPAIRYDLARCMALPFGGPMGASGLIISLKGGNFKQLRKTAHFEYKKFKDKPINTPTLGPVELSRLAWRHMFRAGRAEIYKQRSLEIIPYLEIILTRFPDEQAIIASDYWEKDGYQYRSLEHLLKYRKGTIRVSGTIEFEAILIVRAVEEVRFPKNWANKAMLSQEVQRRVVLRSAYYKKHE